MYNFIIPCSPSNVIVPKYCHVGASLAHPKILARLLLIPYNNPRSFQYRVRARYYKVLYLFLENKTSYKLYSIVTHFVNFKHNFHKEIETFFKNILKWIQEICFKINPFSSELPFHVHNWLIISLKDFCIVIRKWPPFWPSNKVLHFIEGLIFFDRS